MFGREEFGVSDTGHGLLGLEFFGEYASNEVDRLIVEHREKEVAVVDVGLFEHLGRSRVTDDGEEVGLLFETSEEFGVRVDHGDVVVEKGKRFGEVETHFAVACDNDIHCMLILSRAVAAVEG